MSYKKGDRVTVNSWGELRNGKVSRDQESSVVFVVLDGSALERWFHESSLKRLEFDSARDLARSLMIDNPGVEFAVNANDNALAIRESSDEPWRGIFAKLLTGGWANYPNVRANGVPMVTEWEQVKP
jgi:hypothetical protein